MPQSESNPNKFLLHPNPDSKHQHTLLNLIKKAFTPAWIPFFIFLFAFSFTIIPQLFVPEFTSSDDPYYHVSHAHAYWSNTSIEYPSFSTLSTRPVDLWFLYHVLMAPFTFLFNGTNHEVLVLGSKFYHAFLASLFALLLYFTAKSYADKVRPLYLKQMNLSGASLAGILSPHIIGVCSVMALIAVSDLFSARIFVLTRPHVLMIILTLLAAWSIISGRLWLLFLASALAPLSYSFSLLVFTPALALFLSSLIIELSWSSVQRALVPLLITAAGITLGVFLHPGSENYLFNAWMVPALSLLTALSRTLVPGGPQGETATPAEFAALPDMGLVYLVLLALATTLCIARIVGYLRRKRSAASEYTPGARTELMFFIIGAGFSFIMIFIQRAVEYAAPFLMVALVTYLGLFIVPKTRSIHESFAARPGEIGDAYRSLINLIGSLSRERPIKIATYVFLISTFIIIPFTRNVVLVYTNRHSLHEYKAAANFIYGNASGGTTLLAEFNYYPQLVFFEPEAKYSSGMDPRFTHLFNEELGVDAENFSRGKPICGKRVCVNTALKDAYETLKGYGITLIFANASSTSTHILKSLEADSRFKKVFSDPHYPQISVYSL